MKYIYIFIITLFIPVIAYSQDNSSKKTENVQETTVVVINDLGKAASFIGSITSFIRSEIKEYKKDIDECLPEETKEEYRQVGRIIKQGFKDCVKEAHRGFRQGLRGEEYDPNKD